jgi:hypothetical protein
MNEKREIRDLEQRMRRLEDRMDELVRLLKRASDEKVKRAARRAQ